MNDEQIDAAYQRLVESAAPPGDAARRVSGRLRRRRRNRVAGVAVTAVALIAGVGGVAAATLGGDARDAVDGGVATAPPSSEVVIDEQPGELTCPAGTRIQGGEFYPLVFKRLTKMLEHFEVPGNVSYLDRAARTITIFWPDAPEESPTPQAREVLRWSGDADTRWMVDGKSSCEGQRDVGRSTLVDVVPAKERVRLEVGHCWIEPVEIAGRVWDVVGEDQFGSGGRMPSPFASRGEAWTAGDIAFYRDDAGKLLTLVPDGDPWEQEFVGCR